MKNVRKPVMQRKANPEISEEDKGYFLFCRIVYENGELAETPTDEALRSLCHHVEAYLAGEIVMVV